ncbi:hypothetical protein [Pasteuria penetrans]|uniref:hypothetical protein n=1 Tax=Pasteuria penetrans TaxID=86005 RepID=UPI000FB9BD44|nr:hypothetical protein [Pasteuria penetrans]
MRTGFCRPAHGSIQRTKVRGDCGSAVPGSEGGWLCVGYLWMASGSTFIAPYIFFQTVCGIDRGFSLVAWVVLLIPCGLPYESVGGSRANVSPFLGSFLSVWVM